MLVMYYWMISSNFGHGIGILDNMCKFIIIIIIIIIMQVWKENENKRVLGDLKKNLISLVTKSHQKI